MRAMLLHVYGFSDPSLMHMCKAPCPINSLMEELNGTFVLSKVSKSKDPQYNVRHALLYPFESDITRWLSDMFFQANYCNLSRDWSYITPRCTHGICRAISARQ